METQQNENKQAKTPNPGAAGCERLDRFIRECQGGKSCGEMSTECARELLGEAEGGDCAFSRRCGEARPECSVNAEPHPTEDYRRIWVKDATVTRKDNFGIISTVSAGRYSED